MKIKKIIVLLILLMMGSFLCFDNVYAIDVFKKSEDKFDYDEEEDLNEKVGGNVNIEDVNDEGNSKKNKGIILVEVFCGIIGVVMVILALKSDEDE